MAPEDRVSIAVLYPELLGTYGDWGNAVVLAQRLHWRGVDAEVIQVGGGETVPTSCHLYVMGGGEDGPQALAARELAASGALHTAVDRGAVVFGVCAGIQILGHTFANPDGSPHPGLGLLDLRLSWVVGDVAPLDDDEVEELRQERFRAVSRSRLLRRRPVRGRPGR